MTRRLWLCVAAAAASLSARAATDRPLPSATVPLRHAPAGADVTFIVSGDSRPTAKGAPVPRTEKEIFSEIALIRPDLVLWSGDTIYGYGDSPAELSREYDALFGRLKRLDVPFFNAPGNHEIHETSATPCTDHATEEAYARRFGRLYGSFDYAGIHFVSLDTAELCHQDEVTGDQLRWLESDLAANRDARATFVFCHTEFFTSPQIDPADQASHPPVKNRDALIALFRKYGVRAVFAGHEHAYWRETHDGIDYFVAGGGGAPLYANADRGGFSHYVLVRVHGSDISYDVIPPGRLYVEPTSKPDRFWLVNATDAEVPVRGLAVTIPAALGACSALSVETDLRRWNGLPVPVAARIASCRKDARATRLRIETRAPRRSSVPVRIVRAPR